MVVRKAEEVECKPVYEGCVGTSVRWLIDGSIGATNFHMRLFEIEPGGHTPRHEHPWEHEVFVLEGEGVVLGEDGEHRLQAGTVVFVPPNETHQFRNTSQTQTLKFLCLIPAGVPTTTRPQPVGETVCKG